MILPDMNTSLSLAEESPAGIADEEDVFDQRPIDSNVIKDYRRLFERTKLKDTNEKARNALIIQKAKRWFKSHGLASLSSHNAYVMVTRTGVSTDSNTPTVPLASHHTTPFPAQRESQSTGSDGNESKNSSVVRQPAFSATKAASDPTPGQNAIGLK